MSYKLSFLIPSRNEEFVARTVQDILENTGDETEILVGLDGYWPTPSIPQHERVTVVYIPVSIGQRSLTKMLARVAKGKYICKADAHTAFDKGFDLKMLDAFKETGDNVVMTATMRNLWAFDWVCECGERKYQDKGGTCDKCQKKMTKDIKWIAKTNPQSNSFCFDSGPHFQYFGSYVKKQVGDIVESMSLQGSFFMMTKEKYFELDADDESLGSWGSQGISIACSFWLSGGRVLVNKKTFYGHMFRTKAQNDFSFPYPISGRQTEHARKNVLKKFQGNWDKQVHPLSWLVEKFWPITGKHTDETPFWSDEDLKKIKINEFKKPTFGVCYISDCRLDPALLKKCQDKLRDSFKGKIVSVTLKPTDFGENVVMDIPREKLSIFKQILKACETLDTDYVFLCDDDCLYPPEHFDFMPPRDDTFYYDLNWWRVRSTDGFAVHFDAKQSNLLCANRELLIDEYRSRVDFIEKNGWQHIGYEPGTRSIRRGGLNDRPSATYFAKEPSIDIRHGKNLTGDKWKKEDFRDPRYSVGWNERYDKSWLESKMEIK